MAQKLGTLFIDAENGAVDVNGVHSLIPTGAPVVSDLQYKYGTQSLALDGSQYYSVLNHVDFNFGSSDFTVDAWIYQTAQDAYCSIVSKSQEVGGSAWTFSVEGNDLTFRIEHVVGWEINMIRTDAISLNTWYHVAATR